MGPVQVSIGVSLIYKWGVIVTYCLSLTLCHLLFVTCCLSHTVCHLLFVTYCFSHAVCHMLFVTYCLSPACFNRRVRTFPYNANRIVLLMHVYVVHSISHWTVSTSHCFSTSYQPQLRLFLIMRPSFAVACWYQSLSSATIHRITTVYTSRSALISWQTRFYSSTCNARILVTWSHNRRFCPYRYIKCGLVLWHTVINISARMFVNRDTK
jgi:hypothetical protein